MKPQFIGFNKPSILILFPVLIPIICCLRNFLLISLNKLYDETNPLFIISKHPMMLGFTSVFSDILTGGIFYIIHLCKSRQNVSNLKKEEQVLQKINPFNVNNRFEVVKIKSKQLYNDPICICLLLMNSFLECGFLTSFIILGKDMDTTIQCYQMNIVLIILEAILSYKFLKCRFYRHRVLALIVIIIGIICICIEKYSSIFNTKTAIALGVYCMISMLDISQKWLMEKRFVLPYKLLVIQGIISTLMFIIAFGFFYLIPCPSPNICYIGKPMEEILATFHSFFTSIDNNATQAILFYFYYYLTCSCYVVCVFSTIGFFSPTLRCMSDTLGTFYFWVISLLFYEESFYWLTFIMNLIILFSYLVYNEIVILYFCDLSMNTAKEIDSRANEDKGLAELTQIELNKELSNSISYYRID